MRRVVRPGIVAVVFSLLTVTSVGALANAQSSEDSPAGFSADLAGVGPEAPDYRSTLQASDPRIPGTWTESVGPSTTVFLEDDAGEEVSIWSNAIRIDNAEGSWVGPSEGFVSESSSDSETIFLVGDGAYEGLTATLFAPAGEYPVSGIVGGRHYEGVIFPVGWLPVAEPPAS